MALSWQFRPRGRKPGHGVTLIFPFTDKGGVRAENYEWLLKYYRHNLPGAQIIRRGWPTEPFNKSGAVNRAFRDATGDVIVIIDADCYMDTAVILEAAQVIREARARGHHTWIMPYRELYRLTRDFSRIILDYVNPTSPHAARFADDPLDPAEYENHGQGSMHGHMFGALIQVMPREAFEAVGGMDERFCGWGGEDISFARALDTLWGRHRSLPFQALHLWHPTHQGPRNWTSRLWDGQDRDDRGNEHLAQRYFDAWLDFDRMYRLTRER